MVAFFSATLEVITSYGQESAPGLTMPPEIVLEPKSHKKAIALSLLLPGLGEQYMGDKFGAIRAYVIEGSIWATLFGFRWYAGLVTKNYILYAHANSGAKPGESEAYYDAVEWYEDLEAYRRYIREEARYLYPDNLEGQHQYFDEHNLSDNLTWSWEDESEWGKYRSLRKEKREILQRATYCIGAALLNRVISAVIAIHEPPRYGLLIEPNGFKFFVALK